MPCRRSIVCILHESSSSSLLPPIDKPFSFPFPFVPQVFLSHVLSRTDSVSSVRSFARSLLRSRHGDAAPGPGGRSLAQERARLREEGSGSGSGSGGSHRDRTFRCLRDNSSWHAEMRNRLG